MPKKKNTEGYSALRSIISPAAKETPRGRRPSTYQPFDREFIAEMIEDQPPDGRIFVVTEILSKAHLLRKYSAWVFNRYGQDWKRLKEAYKAGETDINVRTLYDYEKEWKEARANPASESP